jgi:hypothetical protein
MKTSNCNLDSSLILVLVVQPNDQLIIFVDPQNYRPINGSIDNFKTSKCMHPIQMKDTLKGFFSFEIHITKNHVC